MTILDGKKIAQKILKKIKKEIEKKNLCLQLTVVLIGRDKSSMVYVKNKERIAKEIGVSFRFYHFKDISQKELEKRIKKIARDPKNSGVVVQLPLPKKFSVNKILNLIPPKKDIDFLSARNLGYFCQGNFDILPPTVSAVSKILKEYKIETKGKNIVLLGKGRLVGRPLSAYFLFQKATVSILDKETPHPEIFTKKADILISGTGKPSLVRGEMVKKGAVLIDFGSKIVKGKTKGDIDFQSAKKKASFLTPVPGGIGPLTVACLFENLVKFSKKGFLAGEMK